LSEEGQSRKNEQSQSKGKSKYCKSKGDKKRWKSKAKRCKKNQKPKERFQRKGQESDRAFMSFLPCLREVQFEPVLPSFEKL
jgi:hypothetical protein